MKALQVIDGEYREWRERNFPQNQADHQLLGMIEEVGELSHAFLKMEQGIRGSRTEHQVAMLDSVGDACIFTMGYIQLQGLDLRIVGDNYVLLHPHNDSMTGLIFHLMKKLAWVINNHDNHFSPQVGARKVGEFLGSLELFCMANGWELEEIIAETWQIVKQRDWTKNKEDGIWPDRTNGPKGPDGPGSLHALADDEGFDR